MGVVTVPPSTTRMPDPLRRRGPGSQNLSGVAARPGEVVVEEVDRGGGDEPTWMQGLESVMEGEESGAGSQGADGVGSQLAVHTFAPAEC